MPLLYHTASKHSFSPPSGWPFYLLPSFPRWAASTHNLLLFHVWSAVEEDKGLVQAKINEVVYMAYVLQESAIPFFFSFKGGIQHDKELKLCIRVAEELQL